MLDDLENCMHQLRKCVWHEDDDNGDLDPDSPMMSNEMCEAQRADVKNKCNIDDDQTVSCLEEKIVELKNAEEEDGNNKGDCWSDATETDED